MEKCTTGHGIVNTHRHNVVLENGHKYQVNTSVLNPVSQHEVSVKLDTVPPQITIGEIADINRQSLEMVYDDSLPGKSKTRAIKGSLVEVKHENDTTRLEFAVTVIRSHGLHFGTMLGVYPEQTVRDASAFGVRATGPYTGITAKMILRTDHEGMQNTDEGWEPKNEYIVGVTKVDTSNPITSEQVRKFTEEIVEVAEYVLPHIANKLLGETYMHTIVPIRRTIILQEESAA